MKLEIYGTLGPSCCDQTTIEQLIQNGMTGMRLNLSHCTLEERKEWIAAFHQACTVQRKKLSLMIDMQGPELRLKDFKPFELEEKVILDASILPESVLDIVCTDDVLLIDDGKIQLKVEEKTGSSLVLQVICPGLLKPKKSIAVKDKPLSGPVLTSEDLANLKNAQKFGITALMQPFVRCKEDLIELKKALHQLNLNHLKIYAKIEDMQGVHHLKELLAYCDVVVIARGDLANASTLEMLPCIQKDIETICHQHRKPYMVVTEMLHSMIEHPVATRAEVSDIFHAVYHGASEIMLTSETASGKYPVHAMRTFHQVAEHALAYKEKENNHD